jgi:hypothetical protein
VIKSVHDFVRRRDQAREAVPPQELLDAILPLVSLQARKLGVRVQTTVEARPAPALCDRTMVEQVLLNLARNAMQAMDDRAIAPRGPGHPGAARGASNAYSRLAGVFCDGLRRGHPARGGAAAVHAVFHHARRGHGAGSEHVPHGGRAARWVLAYEPNAPRGTVFTLPVKIHLARLSTGLTLMEPVSNAIVYIVDDDAGVREALAWLLRSRRLPSESFDSAEAFDAMLKAQGRTVPTLLSAAGCAHARHERPGTVRPAAGAGRTGRHARDLPDRPCRRSHGGRCGQARGV